MPEQRERKTNRLSIYLIKQEYQRPEDIVASTPARRSRLTALATSFSSLLIHTSQTGWKASSGNRSVTTCEYSRLAREACYLFPYRTKQSTRILRDFVWRRSSPIE